MKFRIYNITIIDILSLPAMFLLIFFVSMNLSLATEDNGDSPLVIDITDEQVADVLSSKDNGLPKNPANNNSQNLEAESKEAGGRVVGEDSGKGKDEIKDESESKSEEKSIFERKQMSTSMFLNNRQFEELMKAFKFFESGEEGEYIKGEITEEEKKEKVMEEIEEEKLMANVYLNSILYISKDNWSVWLNGQKITNETNDEDNELYLLEVSKNKVIVLWSVSISKWEIIVPDLEYLKTVEVNEDNEVENIFTLRPNQTYLPIEDRVVEGKMGDSSNLIAPTGGGTRGFETLEIPLD